MDIGTILLLLLLLYTIIFVYLRIFQKTKNNFLDTLPKPPGLPIIGNVLDINSPTKILNKTEEYIRDYGKRFMIKAVNFPVFFTIDRKFIEFLLSRNLILSKSENYAFLHPWLGTGLLTGDGPKWKHHRKIITPTFHFTILKRFVSTFESTGDILIEKLTNLNNTTNIDVFPIISLCTLDIICETAMGAKINAQNDTTSDYVNAIKEICRLLINRCLSPIELFDITFKFTKNYQRQKKFINILHDYSRKIIKQKIAIIKRKQQFNDDDDHDDDHDITKKKSAFLDLLLELNDINNNNDYDDDDDDDDEKESAFSHFLPRSTNNENRLTTEELREEVDTIMFEGHDTTAVAISFTLYCLANHPEFQEKAFNEQIRLFGNEKNPDITYDDLNNMKYLELIIKESLRLYPSVPFIGRYTTNDVEFENKIIPKGTNIVIPIYFLHRDPEIFDNPTIFNPERFNNLDNNSTFAYIPFSAGSRNCIGQKFAMLEMKSILSKIVRHFKLTPAVPQYHLELSAEIVLKPLNGIHIGLRRRA